MRKTKRTVVVTGGNRGIGKAIALSFAQNDDNVIIIGRDEETIAEVVAMSENISGFNGDVSKYEEMKNVFAKIKEQFGNIDILINNAGINTRVDYRSTNLELWTEEININLTGAFICSQLVINEMVEQKYGVIIMIASIKAFDGAKSLSYGASKAGLVSLAKSYAKAVSKFGVRVNSISPGMVETDMAKLRSEDDKKKFLERLAINRFAQPEELASFVKYVCSDEASFITGTNLFFDGGYMT